MPTAVTPKNGQSQNWVTCTPTWRWFGSLSLGNGASTEASTLAKRMMSVGGQSQLRHKPRLTLYDRLGQYAGSRWLQRPDR
jgi:hypothetical protein